MAWSFCPWGFGPASGCAPGTRMLKIEDPFACLISHVSKSKEFCLFKSGQMYMKDAECAESKDKSIFLFLFFELSGKLIEN